MAELLQKCCVCKKSFHVQFSYQMEEHVGTSSDGESEVSFRFYCSQACSRSSRAQNNLVPCSACGTAFELTHAAQVLVESQKRRYACGDSCREQLLSETRGRRLSEVLDGQPVQASQQAPALVPPRAAAQLGRVASKPPRARPDAVGSPIQVPAVPAAPPSSRPGPRVLAVFNHKGGTGKTTTAVTVASGLAAAGHKTLLVDTDAQGNVGVSLGLKGKRSLYHVLVMGLQLQEAIQSSRPNLDVLSANETLAAAELYLAGRKNRDRVLSSRLEQARADYDYVIVDCSPSLSLLNQNALVFADAVLCPVACDYLSLVGVRQVVKTIKNVNRLLGHPVQLWGVLPTLYDRRARICREALETLQEHFGGRCLEPIRSAIRVKEAPSQAQTLLEYAADSSAAIDYNKVIARLITDGMGATVGSEAKSA